MVFLEKLIVAQRLKQSSAFMPPEISFRVHKSPALIYELDKTALIQGSVVDYFWWQR
jgi:hypothetical protein